MNRGGPQTANFILWHQPNQNALLFGDANQSNYHHISFIGTTFDMFLLHHSLIFPMFFSEKFKPIGVPTHWTQATLMPKRKVLARALCAFTFGDGFRWQVFSHQTRHPERWDCLMFRAIKTPQNHNTKRNLPKVQMEGIEQCKIPLFKKDCFSLWSLKRWGKWSTLTVAYS